MCVCYLRVLFTRESIYDKPETGQPQIPDCPNISVCEHPTINRNTKNRYITLVLEVVL